MRFAVGPRASAFQGKQTTGDSATWAAKALLQNAIPDSSAPMWADGVVCGERTQAETTVRVALVSIYRAFGGGWSDKVDKALDAGSNSRLPIAED